MAPAGTPPGAVIDLGTVELAGGGGPRRRGRRSDPGGDLPPDRQAASRADRPVPAGRRSWYAMALAGLVLLVAAGASAPSGPAGLRRAGSIAIAPFGTYQVRGDALSVVESSTRTDLYRPGGRSVPLADASGARLVATTGRTVVLGYDSCPDYPDPFVSGVDNSTGVRRWRRWGVVRSRVGGYLLIERTPAGGFCESNGAAATRVTLDVVRSDTGTVLWTLLARSTATVATGRDATNRLVLLAVDPGGRWSRHDLGTGAALPPFDVPAAASTPPPVPGGGGGVAEAPGRTGGTPAGPGHDPAPASGTSGTTDYTQVLQLPGAVVTIGYAGPSYRLVALDPATLTGRWYVSGYGYAVAHPCAGYVCVTVADSTVARRLDTGAVAWRSPYSIDLPLGSRFAVATLRGGGQSGMERTAVLDLSTGQPVASLRGWSRADGSTADDWRPDAPDRIVLYRTAAGRTWFARLQPGEGPPSPVTIGSVPYPYPDCLPGTGFVACRHQDVLDIWRLP